MTNLEKIEAALVKINQIGKTGMPQDFKKWVTSHTVIEEISTEALDLIRAMKVEKITIGTYDKITPNMVYTPAPEDFAQITGMAYTLLPEPPQTGGEDEDPQTP